MPLAGHWRLRGETTYSKITSVADLPSAQQAVRRPQHAQEGPSRSPARQRNTGSTVSNPVMRCKSVRFSLSRSLSLSLSLSLSPSLPLALALALAFLAFTSSNRFLGITAHKHAQAQQYYGAQARPGATGTTSRKTKSRKKNKKKPPELPSAETENQTKALLENSMLAACATRPELS